MAEKQIPDTIFSITGNTNFQTRLKQLSKFSVVELGRRARTEFSDIIRQNTTTKNKIIKEAQLRKDTLEVGSMFFYVYDAKHKDRLPYWDKFPLTIVIQNDAKRFYGLNLHYLHPLLRVELLSQLFPYKSTKTIAKTTQLKASYDVIKTFLTRHRRMALFCLKKYLHSQVKSQPFLVPPKEWLTSVYLPFESFEKQSKSYVYSQLNRRLD